MCVRLSKRSWVVLVITYLLCIASFDWLFKYHWPIILHDTFVHPYDTCFTVNLTETARYETLRSLLRKPWKKEKGQMTLLSESLSSNISGSALMLILPLLIIMKQIQEKKEEIWFSPMKNWQHKNATKNFGYTTISDRLRTVSWSNDSYKCNQLVWSNQFTGSQPSNQSEFRPNTIFLWQCLSWFAIFTSTLVLISVVNFKIYS